MRRHSSTIHRGFLDCFTMTTLFYRASTCNAMHLCSGAPRILRPERKMVARSYSYAAFLRYIPPALPKASQTKNSRWRRNILFIKPESSGYRLIECPACAAFASGPRIGPSAVPSSPFVMIHAVSAWVFPKCLNKPSAQLVSRGSGVKSQHGSSSGSQSLFLATADRQDSIIVRSYTSVRKRHLISKL